MHTTKTAKKQVKSCKTQKCKKQPFFGQKCLFLWTPVDSNRVFLWVFRRSFFFFVQKACFYAKNRSKISIFDVFLFHFSLGPTATPPNVKYFVVFCCFLLFLIKKTSKKTCPRMAPNTRFFECFRGLFQHDKKMVFFNDR